MKTIGERINEFDNSLTKTVGRFNMLFPECPLNYNSDYSLEIGDITMNATTRLLTIAGIDMEWELQRKLNSEKNDEEITTITDDNTINDSDWLLYFV